ncbi:UTP--glucose-1-phosphate uridylyltransferase GalU [Acidobacteria bacterium AH-259-O06]|nr:UTP--glucose-1-phosphate uridylyltransferase GalU [Acidobacteria bacterium AH-259-G07]MDA2929553.1 UTP--glucose-1-phosphate uridylyltransferase GalU [Acidobacteria bacterium AH-259-O06]
MERVRKAVIPAAGMGTRFLPATKAIPKEMLPIVDKPTIQYVVEEAVQSGFEDIIFVTGQGKNEIEDHFDYDYRLEHRLKEQGKEDLLRIVRNISEMIAVSSIRQKKPLGLGHAVQITEAFTGDEPFGVFLGDDIVVHKVPCMKQLLTVYDRYQASVVAVEEVPWESVSRFGLVAVEPVESKDPRLLRIRDMVEKPPREEAPSNLAIIGRYILMPGVFQALKKTTPGAGGEIQLTDGLRGLMELEPVYAYRFEGTRYDVGNKLEYLIATVEFALRREDLQEEFRDYLRSLKL